MNKLHAAGLQFYWTMGQEVKVLVDQPNNYGGHTVENFVADLNARCNSGFSTSTIYKAIAFHKLIEQDQLKKMVDSGVAWRNVIPLLRADLTEEERVKIIDSVAGKELTQDKIADEVTNIKGVNPKTRTGKEKPEQNSFGTLKQTVERLEEVVDMVAGVRSLVEEVIDGTDQTLRQELAGVVADIDKAVKELNDTWTDDKTELDDVLKPIAEEAERTSTTEDE
jgi:hypothetical protein